MTDPRIADDGRTQHQRMLAGDLYFADDPEIASAGRVAMAFMAAYNAMLAERIEDRQQLLARWLGACGPGVDLRPPFFCDYGTQITIGARVFANFGLVALDVARITIGDDVQIGPNVQLLTPTHPLDADLRRAKWEAAEPITIGHNAWLGGGAIVLPGVSIGENTVVGAGAVVTKDLPANVLAVGNPARVIRAL
jgi:maltose O-acetyltransferase